MSHPLEYETGLDDRAGDPVVEYLETIALLQDEVARLEQELRCRSQGPSDDVSDGAASDRGGIDSESAVEASVARAEVERLEAELAGREETIGLLLDQLSRVEEAQAASRAEWEQLAGWLTELERRVEGQDDDASLRLQEQLAVQQRHADELRKEFEQGRRAAESQRQVYEGEIARLRAALTRTETDESAVGESLEGRATPEGATDFEAIDPLRSENLRLRAALQELAERGAARPSEARDDRLAEAQQERDALRRQLEQIRDEQRREHLEHGAIVAELQGQLSRASLVRPESLPQAPSDAEATSRARDEQLRFQALRQHLLDIHKQEEQDRKQKQLIPRLSRLWSRTGPR